MATPHTAAAARRLGLGPEASLAANDAYPLFDGLEALPESLPAALKKKILLDNPLATYSRLRESAPKEIRQ